MSQRPQKRQSSSSYRLIHGRQPPPAQHQEYFPSRAHPITARQPSESSRRSQKQSFSSSLATEPSQHLSKQNERLKKEISKLQGLLLPHQDQKATLKNLELELVETYRVIHYYDGKLKQLEGICIIYEREFGPIEHKKNRQTKVGGQLIEELRKANAELKGKNAKQSFEIQIITNQLRKMEYKYHSIQQQLLQANKKPPTSNNSQSIPLLINRQNSNRKQAKFIDDYQHNNLICSPKQQPIKRRPQLQLSKSKKNLTKANGESDSDGSGVSVQYKNSVYIKRQKQKNSSSKQQSLRHSKHQSTVFGNLSSRLNSMQGELQVLRKQNEKLQEQLDQKIKQILNFEEKIQDLQQKKSLSPESREPTQKIIVKMSKQRLNEIPKPMSKNENVSNNLKTEPSPSKMDSNSSNNLSQFVSNITGPKIQVQKSSSSQQYSFKFIKQITIRKLTVNLARQCISYLNFIQNLSKIWSSGDRNILKQTLQQQPYRLNPQQYDQFQKEGEEIVRIFGRDSSKLKGILRECIPFFNNITIRRDFTLNIQTANKFKNYTQELELLTNQYGNRMPYHRFPDFVAQLYLTPEEALFLQIKNAQQYEDYEFFHLADLLKYFLLQ